MHIDLMGTLVKGRPSLWRVARLQAPSDRTRAPGVADVEEYAKGKPFVSEEQCGYQKNKTIIVISHNYNIVKNFDHIIKL